MFPFDAFRISVPLLAVLFVLCGSPHLAARTFFVSPQGDDARDGFSAKTAWRTIAKVNGAALDPGDTVCLQRGGVWREVLKPSRDGRPGRPITFESYGSGAKPVLSGSEPLSSARWMSVHGGVRQTAHEAEVFCVLAGTTFLRSTVLRTKSKELEPNLERLARKPGTWFWKRGQLYVSVAEADDPPKLVAVVREDLIFVEKRRHLVFRDLAVVDSARFDSGYGVRIFGSEDITLERCEALRCGKHNFGVINSTRVTLRECIARGAMPDQGYGGASAYVSYSDNSRRGDTSLYDACLVEDYSDAGEKAYPAFVTHGEGIGAVDIRGLVSRGTGLSLGSGESGARLRLAGGEIIDGDLTLFGGGVLVDGVTLRGGVVEFHGEGDTLQNCLIVGANPGQRGHQSAVVDRGKRNVVRFCTIVLSEEAKGFNSCLALVKPNSGLRWEHNIIAGRPCGIRVWFPGFDAARYSARGNVYREGATFQFDNPPKLEDLPAWQARGLDAQSIAADPRFIGGEYGLDADSPARDFATAATALPATDLRGTPRSQGPAADAGAFEFKSR